MKTIEKNNQVCISVDQLEPVDPEKLQGMERTVFDIVKDLVEPFDAFDNSEITECVSATTDLSLNQVSGYLGQLVQKGLIEPYEMDVNGKTFESFKLI